MQTILPIFTTGTVLINHNVGYFKIDGLLQYVVNGLPIFSHNEDDLISFRFFTSVLISQGLCFQSEIASAFGVSITSVARNLTIYKQRGNAGFFKEIRQGGPSKLTEATLALIQKKLDAGETNSSIAREFGFTEGAIRAAIKKNKLKKN